MAYRSRARVARILAHKEADRVPYCAISNPQIKGIVGGMDLSPDHRAFCLEGDFAFVYIEPDVEIGRFEPYLGALPANTEVSYWGIGQQPQVTQAGWHAGHRMFHPLANVDTVQGLERYPFPDLASSGADEGLEEKVRDLKAQGYTVLGQMSQTILETAYNMRGIPRLMLDFYERPRYVDVLFAKIVEQRIFQARRFAEAGVDILRIGDDIATQVGLLVSPALYQERIKPLHASVINAARRVNPHTPVKYHSDGKLTALLPDLVDIGVNIINPVQPECMDLAQIKHAFGDQLVLWGCMPVQSVFAHGSRVDVQRHIAFLMERIAVNGGLVLKFTNFLMTDRSLANMRVFLELFYEMGVYE
jgi:uroporphyrinogen decarboxylase